MNRNTELHFSETPQIDIKRSKFEMSHSHKTTFNVGDIIPIEVSEILPGDTVQLDMASLVRMATPIYPIMDNLYMDTYFFFVPNRLLWDHWAEFWGQNDDPWTQQIEYQIPQITAPTGGWSEGTIADYMGIPTKVANLSVSALFFRSYAKCVNDWFRDENLKRNCHIYKDETTRTGSNGNNYVTDVELGGKPAKAAKMHDFFTSALPAPQRGPSVTIPLGSVAPLTGTATGNVNVTIPGSTDHTLLEITNGNPYTRFGKYDHTTVATTQGASTSFKLQYVNQTGDFSIVDNTTNFGVIPNNLGIKEKARTGTGTATINLNNGYADLSQATASTINQLRTAFAIQKYYENAGLHGTRYIEYLRSVFGVTSSDARLQRAEYLGGERIPLNIDQIIQTSSTDSTSPQGNTSGFSCTYNSADMFTKSFEEHGILLGLAVVRTEHTYQQGLHRMFSRKKWLDYYNPFFANLGEAGIENRQIYAQGTNKDSEIFGYQEAWAEYRYAENRVSGYMRSNATGSLDVWHFADKYNALPILGETWIDEPYENVDRTIAVTSQLTHQFIADFYFKTYYTRPMPVYSIPGLIDHV